MKADYVIGNTEIYNIENDKFKTSIVDVTFIDSLSKERAYKNGLLQDILCAGTEKYKNSLEISRRCCELYATEISSSVENTGEIQLIHFSMTMTEEKFLGIDEKLFEKAVKLLFEIIYRPYTEKGCFSQKIFNREKENYDDNLRAEINDKRTYGLKRIRELAYEGEAYALSAGGSIEDGEKLTAEELYKYYMEYFVKKLKVKIFCHSSYDMSIVKKVIEENKFFGSDDVTQYNFGFRPYKMREFIVKEEKFDINQEKLNICYKTDAEPESDIAYVTVIANAILGVGVNSLLFKNVREKSSLAYYISSRYTRQKGCIVINCGIDGKNREKTESMIFEMVDKIKKGDFKAADIKCAKKYFESIYASYADDQINVIDYNIIQSFYKKEQSVYEFVEKLNSVKKKDIVEAAGKWHLDCEFIVSGNEKCNADCDAECNADCDYNSEETDNG